MRIRMQDPNQFPREPQSLIFVGHRRDLLRRKTNRLHLFSWKLLVLLNDIWAEYAQLSLIIKAVRVARRGANPKSSNRSGHGDTNWGLAPDPTGDRPGRSGCRCCPNPCTLTERLLRSGQRQGCAAPSLTPVRCSLVLRSAAA